MTKILLNQPSSDLLVKEENQLDWNKVLEKLKKTFGSDIYESWIKNVNLKKFPFIYPQLVKKKIFINL